MSIHQEIADAFETYVAESENFETKGVIDSAVSNRDFNQIDADRLSILSVSDWQDKKNSL